MRMMMRRRMMKMMMILNDAAVAFCAVARSECGAGDGRLALLTRNVTISPITGTLDPSSQNKDQKSVTFQL